MQKRRGGAFPGPAAPPRPFPPSPEPEPPAPSRTLWAWNGSPRLLALRGAITLAADTKDEVSEKGPSGWSRKLLARNDVNHD